MKKQVLDKDKGQRIAQEELRLRESCQNINSDMLCVVDGLIQRAAFMRVSLEDLEKDLNENGSTEMFSQSEKAEPYQRERPVARLYINMNKNYQTITKQLSDLVSKFPKTVEYEEDELEKLLKR